MQNIVSKILSENLLSAESENAKLRWFSELFGIWQEVSEMNKRATTSEYTALLLIHIERMLRNWP